MRHTKRNPGAGDARVSEIVLHGQAADRPQDNHPAPRLQVLAERVHRLGPRALHELIVELVEQHGPEVLDRVEAYARLDPGVLRIMDGHRFPPRLAVIAGGWR